MRHRASFDPTPRPSLRTMAPTVSEAVTNSPVPPNPYVPPIPPLAYSDDPDQLSNLTAVVYALKAAVESLTGQRGDPANRAVTFKDLVDYGVLSQAALSSPNGSLAVTDPTLRPTVTSFKFTPADLTGTSSPTGVMLGLGITVTTGLTGALLVEFTGAMQLDGPVEANIGHVELRFGTNVGEIPANGTAPMGTVSGTPLDMTELAASARQPLAYTTIINGLDPLTEIWLDIMQAVSNGSVSLYDLNITVLGL